MDHNWTICGLDLDYSWTTHGPGFRLDYICAAGWILFASAHPPSFDPCAPGIWKFAVFARVLAKLSHDDHVVLHNTLANLTLDGRQTRNCGLAFSTACSGSDCPSYSMQDLVSMYSAEGSEVEVEQRFQAQVHAEKHRWRRAMFPEAVHQFFDIARLSSSFWSSPLKTSCRSFCFIKKCKFLVTYHW